jgi:ribosome-associated protein
MAKKKTTVKKIAKPAAKKTAPTKKAAKSAVKKVVKPARPSAGKTAAKTVKKSAPKTAKKKTLKTPTVIDETKRLADAVVEGILEKKGKNISVLNLKNIHNRVCDYFIICQADSTTQVNAVAGSVEEIVKKKTGEKPYRSEGFENSEWILIDYVTVVVHVFQSHIRNFYNLEALWADADVTEIAFD